MQDSKSKTLTGKTCASPMQNAQNLHAVS